MRTPTDPAELACEFLVAVKRGGDREAYLSTLSDLKEPSLVSLGREATKAFWINVYNALVQHDLERDPTFYERKREFFGDDRFTIAGTQLSLDDIEHGILRSSKWKYGLGYIPRPIQRSFERTHRLQEVDPRIHFALNCGAESCPPILAYTANDVEAELETSTRSFLQRSSTYDRAADELWVTRLFLYYRGDFGGRSGIYDCLETAGVIDDGDRPRVRYQPYDWTLHKGMYRDSET